MHFIGDIHGDYTRYQSLIQSIESSIQLGDMGIGFVEFPAIDPRHRFIRGNHDNPTLCQSIPNYMGDFGFDGEVFFVSGAASIDRHIRTIGVDWWPEEQLSYTQSIECLELYESIKPDIVVSHDCPLVVKTQLVGSSICNSPDSTTLLLNELLDIHTPYLWVFGHHHKTIRIDMGARFQCVANGQAIEI